jgi:EAL domain-containing protein (putative c-di-GMP-specific phosphodiesterase class I)
MGIEAPPDRNEFDGGDSCPPPRRACTCDQKLVPDFTFAFQPVVDLPARRVCAHEALVRGPEGESAGSILAGVTSDNRYAFDQACRTRAIRMAADLGLDRRLNINFMPNAVHHPDVCLRGTLNSAHHHDFPLASITFEFTEDEPVIDRHHLKGIVESYRRHGFRTALDDFGSGFAGLSLLADFQPDTIKIDRSIIAGIDTDRARQAIVAGVVKMAEMIGLSLVAEGVERADEVTTLQELGIDLYQGFFFARPTLGRLVADHEIAW